MAYTSLSYFITIQLIIHVIIIHLIIIMVIIIQLIIIHVITTHSIILQVIILQVIITQVIITQVIILQVIILNTADRYIIHSENNASVGRNTLIPLYNVDISMVIPPSKLELKCMFGSADVSLPALRSPRSSWM